MKRSLTLAMTLFLVFETVAIHNALIAQPLPKDVFARRRQQFMDKMASGVAIFRSAKVANRNGDVDYDYRQNSDFYYLTGFEEPESAFLLIPGGEKKFIMFVRPRNPQREVWTGKRYGVEGAMTVLGADTAFTIDRFEEMLPRYLAHVEKLYYTWSSDMEFTDKLLKLTPQLRGIKPEDIADPIRFIHDRRIIKDATEISLLRRAIDITCDGHREAMKAASPGMYEYELQAVIEYVFKKNGAVRLGFPSIVGSGPNSTTLHYDYNNRKAENGDVVVVDIGAEYGYYTADVTRTIPINGTFSKEQREIYEIVLRAQQESIDMARPGVSLKETQDHAVDVVKDGLYRLGLITDKNSDWQYRIWLPHGVGHWLGLDVHDVGNYRRDDPKGRTLESGMVYTVEPGIYIRENALENIAGQMLNARFAAPSEEIATFVEKVKPAAEKYRNIGVRIEDDVLITETGHELLSSKAPRTVADIERMMKGQASVPAGSP